MEDVLALYHRPAEAGVSRLCFDERPCQLLDDALLPLPMQPGLPRKVDYEYTRQGTCVVLLAYDIERGQRYVQVRSRRTKQDYAEFMDWLLRTHYADADKVQVVQDNLNTPTEPSTTICRVSAPLRWRRAWSFTSPLNTPVGSTWPN
jgi:hypothetical protein